MTQPASLPALRELLRAITSLQTDIAVDAIAAASSHVEAIEQALAASRKAPAELAAAKRTLETLQDSTAGQWRHLHDLTERPGYRALDAFAQRVRRPRYAAWQPAPAEPSDVAAAPQPPIAVAVVETRELLAAVAAEFADDAALAPAAERARAELDRITPELTTGQAITLELQGVLQQVQASRAQLAGIQEQALAVRRRINSRALDFLHLPARAKSQAPAVPPLPGTKAPSGWPEIPAAPAGPGAGHGDVVAHLDLPEPPVVVLEGETLLLVGWAFTARAPVSKVEVTLDGEPAGKARIGIVRSDVHAHYRIPHTMLCGFEFLVDPSHTHGRERVTVAVFAETLQGGRALIASREVWVAASLDRPIVVDTSAITPAAIPRSQTPNLLVFTHDLSFGGGQLWLVEALDQMGAGRDFPCTVVAPHPGPLAPVLRRLGIRVHVNGGVPVDRADSYEGRLAEMASWAAPQRFTSVLANTFLAFAGADLATRLGLPCIWAIHESWPPATFWSVAYPPGGIDRQVKHAAMRALAASSAVVFEAEATRALYAGVTRPGAAMVVRYGIRTRAIRDYCAAVDQGAARKLLGLSGFRRVVLVMGTVEPRKGQALLALAFEQIAHAHPDTALALVGAGDTPYVHGLMEYLRLSGLNQQVRVQPMVADSQPWYRAADALVCASDVESMPRSVLEAMAFGLPVSSAAVFGLPELIADGRTGLLFDPADIGAAGAALDRLLNMPAEALSAIADAGRQHVFDHYDSAGYAGRIRSLIYEGLDDDTLAPAR